MEAAMQYHLEPFAPTFLVGSIGIQEPRMGIRSYSWKITDLEQPSRNERKTQSEQ